MKSTNAGEIVSNSTYHGEWPEISSSQFKPFYMSPAAFRYPMPREQKQEWALGTATHTAVLEPDKLGEILILPNAPFNTNAGKEVWWQWLCDNGRTDAYDLKRKDDIIAAAHQIAIDRDTDAVTGEQYSTACDMAASVAECAEAQEALFGGVNERSYRANGFKARPDCINQNLLVDLKTTAHFDRFEYKAHEFHYPESLAWYEKVLGDCGVAVNHWLWIAIESIPYCAKDDGNRHRVKVWMASDECREKSIFRLDKALEQFALCKETNTWPAYESDIGIIYPRKQK